MGRAFTDGGGSWERVGLLRVVFHPLYSFSLRDHVPPFSDSGALVFVPAVTNIKAGESVDFVNNVGFPHNVVFDEDAIPVRSI